MQSWPHSTLPEYVLHHLCFATSHRMINFMICVMKQFASSIMPLREARARTVCCVLLYKDVTGDFWLGSHGVNFVCTLKLLHCCRQKSMKPS